jgi:hypothetical protein
MLGAQDHPYLPRPAYCLHPCGIPALLAEAATDSAPAPVPINPIVAWLSVAGRVVGLRVPLAYVRPPCTEAAVVAATAAAAAAATAPAGS